MKRLPQLALALALALSLTTGALAAEVPDDVVVENLNGEQRLVKTYTLDPETDPDSLKEPSFDYEGYHYTWAYTTKEEEPYQESKEVTQTVTVETSSKDLSAILEQLAPTIPYDDGEFTGELALDHTTLQTEAAGYTTKYSTTSETKVIGNLDRNDMSYIPATTVKNGKTLSLVNVEWQVTGTDLVGEALLPSRYQAVATYSVSSSYQVATGYITTAEYTGEVTSAGIDHITYTVVYTGAAVVPDTGSGGFGSLFGNGGIASLLPLLGLLLLALAMAGGGVFLFKRRKNVYIYIPGDQPRDYKLVAKFQVKPEQPEIDITGTDLGQSQYAAVEIKHSLAKRLIGQTFTVHHTYGIHQYTVTQKSGADWHEFTLKEEESLCEEDASARSEALAD